MLPGLLLQPLALIGLPRRDRHQKRSNVSSQSPVADCSSQTAAPSGEWQSHRDAQDAVKGHTQADDSQANSATRQQGALDGIQNQTHGVCPVMLGPPDQDCTISAAMAGLTFTNKKNKKYSVLKRKTRRPLSTFFRKATRVEEGDIMFRNKYINEYGKDEASIAVTSRHP